MPMNNPFDNPAFRVSELVGAINRQPHKPGQITATGLFEETGMATVSALVDIQDGVLTMVKDTPRGSPAEQQARNSRSLRPFRATHLARTRRVLADEVQGVRMFGSESTTEGAIFKRDEYLANMKNSIDVTMEYHKIGAIKGQILDADGSTVLLDLFTEFGLTQQTQAMALGTAGTEVRTLVGAAIRKSEDALKDASATGYMAPCGTAFWDAMTSHPKVKELYLNTVKANDMFGTNPLDSFVFGGVTWFRYRGRVNSVDFVGANDAYLVPTGVSGMFITKFAPADYMEAVNTLGLPYYAKAIPEDAFNKAMILEAQSNPLTLCTRADAVIKLTL